MCNYEYSHTIDFGRCKVHRSKQNGCSLSADPTWMFVVRKADGLEDDFAQYYVCCLAITPGICTLASEVSPHMKVLPFCTQVNSPKTTDSLTCMYIPVLCPRPTIMYDLGLVICCLHRTVVLFRPDRNEGQCHCTQEVRKAGKRINEERRNLHRVTTKTLTYFYDTIISSR